MTGEIKRTESSEETESTTTASRRDSEDSDSGVNLSERDREAAEGETGDIIGSVRSSRSANVCLYIKSKQSL